MDTGKYLLRPMHEGDIFQATQIDKEAFPENNSSPPFKKELRQNKLSLYLVVIDETTPYHKWSESNNLPSAPVPIKNNRNKFSRAIWRVLQGEEESIEPTSELVVGYIGIWSVIDQGHIVSIAVRQSHRKEGIGELMIIGAVESNQLMGNNELTLEVRTSNEAAQNLYKKFGFNIVGRRKQYYSDNREDAYIMTTSEIHSEEYKEMMDNLRLNYTERWGLRPRYLDQLS